MLLMTIVQIGRVIIAFISLDETVGGRISSWTHMLTSLEFSVHGRLSSIESERPLMRRLAEQVTLFRTRPARFTTLN